MSISFNLDPPAKFLKENGFVYTWRRPGRPTGKQSLFIKGRRIGPADVIRISTRPEPQWYEQYHLWSGYLSWDEWKTAAENAHKCGIGSLALYRVEASQEVRDRIMLS